MSRIAPRSGDLPKRSLWTRIKELAKRDVAMIGRGSSIQESLGELEDVLVAADFGVPVTLRLIAEVERRARRGEVKTDDELRGALAEGIESALRSGRSDPALFGGAAGLVRSQALLRLSFSRSAPVGLMCIGTRIPDMFQPGLGTELLTFLARTLEVTIAQWLDRSR